MDNQTKCATAWIHKKLNSGVTQQQLYNCVGAFSNKKKKKVMHDKNLTSNQYERRYDFLSTVHYLLANKKF